MVPSNVTFTNFEVEDPLSVILRQDFNKPAFWPFEWSLVIEPRTQNGGEGLREVNLWQWFRNNTSHQIDISMDMNGRRIFAFESDEEAALFKLSF